MKKIFFVSNGEAWSHFVVHGGVIAEDNELPVLEAILRCAVIDVQDAYAKWHKEWDDFKASGGKYKDEKFDKSHPMPDVGIILEATYAKHGFTFTPYSEDMVLP